MASEYPLQSTRPAPFPYFPPSVLWRGLPQNHRRDLPRVRLSILVISHLALQHVRHCWPVHVVVKPQDAARLQRDLPHPQGPALRRIEFVAEIDRAEQLLALSGILCGYLSLPRRIANQKRKKRRLLQQDACAY